MRGRWHVARELFDRAELIFRDRCTGVPWELDTVHNLALWATTHMGEFAELRRRWPLLLQEAQERGDLYAITTLNTYYMTILRLADDDPQGALRELEEVMARWSHRGFHIQHATAMRAYVHVDLYRGDGPGAWARVRRHARAYRRSLLLRVQMLRIEFLELRGRTALAAASAKETSDRRRFWLLQSAARDAWRLDRQDEPWASALARLLRAGIAALRGQPRSARNHLRSAIDAFEAVDMHLHASVARRCLGELAGGNLGSDLIARADQELRDQAIRDPLRMTAVYAPGFVGNADRSEEFQTM